MGPLQRRHCEIRCTSLIWICDFCDATNTVADEGTRHPHTMTHVPAVAATCTKNGSVEYWHCSECGLNYDTAEGANVIEDLATAIDPDNHTLTHHGAVAATCIRTGNVEYWHCEECGRNLNAAGAGLVEVMLAVDPDNHNLVHHDGKDAICTDAGYAAYDACTRCGYTTFAEIAALGHNYGEPKISWSEEKDTCTLTFTCKNDPSHQLVRTVEISQLQPVESASPGCSGSEKKDYTITVEDEDGNTIEVAIPEDEVPASVLPELNSGENAADGEAVQTGGSASTGTIMAAGGVILLLLAVLLIFLLMKKRRNGSDGTDG